MYILEQLSSTLSQEMSQVQPSKHKEIFKLVEVMVLLLVLIEKALMA